VLLTFLNAVSALSLIFIKYILFVIPILLKLRLEVESDGAISQQEESLLLLQGTEQTERMERTLKL
jgi:hypothetical protein